MDFHLEFSPKAFDTTIDHRHRLLLVGSCFTEQIGNKLARHKFGVMDNPNGILFNPESIVRAVCSYIDNRHYTETELFYQNECWNSWEHHSRFSHPDKETCIRRINDSQTAAHYFLQKADWLLITLGSAFVYELENSSVVANCHKVPTDKFNKRLLTVHEVTLLLQEMQAKLSVFNPGLKIIFTISPVRHLRDGFTENNRSKATLINAVHQVTGTGSFYFPAYELVIDDLRDYRFYAEDMVHPNYAATNYVWEKFTTTCINASSQQLMQEINEINAAQEHRSFNPTSSAHQRFLATHLEKVKALAARFPYIDLHRELEYFAGN